MNPNHTTQEPGQRVGLIASLRARLEQDHNDGLLSTEHLMQLSSERKSTQLQDDLQNTIDAMLVKEASRLREFKLIISFLLLILLWALLIGTML